MTVAKKDGSDRITFEDIYMFHQAENFSSLN